MAVSTIHVELEVMEEDNKSNLFEVFEPRMLSASWSSTRRSQSTYPPPTGGRPSPLVQFSQQQPSTSQDPPMNSACNQERRKDIDPPESPMRSHSMSPAPTSGCLSSLRQPQSRSMSLTPPRNGVGTREKTVG